jgi:phosphopantetheinyl transferase
MQLFAMQIDETGKEGEKSHSRTKFLETVLGQDAVNRIQYTVYKKPYIPDGPHFSLSHSGQWLFLALADSPIGADIEKHKVNRNFAGIARRFFFPDEYEAVMTAENRLTAFYDQWVRKESYLKMIGTGFYTDDSLSPKESVSTVTNAEIRLYSQFPGYSAATACRPGTEWPESATLLSLP